MPFKYKFGVHQTKGVTKIRSILTSTEKEMALKDKTVVHYFFYTSNSSCFMLHKFDIFFTSF